MSESQAQEVKSSKATKAAAKAAEAKPAEAAPVEPGKKRVKSFVNMMAKDGTEMVAGKEYDLPVAEADRLMKEFKTPVVEEV